MMQIYLEHEAKGMAYHNLIHDKDIYCTVYQDTPSKRTDLQQ